MHVNIIILFNIIYILSARILIYNKYICTNREDDSMINNELSILPDQFIFYSDI